MVGIVFVSHSATLARGALELARAMAGEGVPLEAAGGTGDPEAPLGTDATAVAEAAARADAGDGVLVLMDLGSAVMSAEMALDFLDDEQRGRVRLCAAPLVEGGVAAAASARAGHSLEDVAAEARGGLAAKQEHLGDELADIPDDQVRARHEADQDEPEAVSVRVALTHRLGLHARPAAHVVRAAARFDARVSVANVTNGKGPASATSLTGLARLGARAGHELEITATGAQAAAAVAELEDLVAGGLGDADDDSGPAPESPPRPASSGAAPQGADESAGEKTLRGVPASPGAAWGPARRLSVVTPEVPRHAAADPQKEWARLRDALAATRAELGAARTAAASTAGDAAAGILDAHMLILEDDALLGEARRLIAQDNRNAAAAWHDVTDSAARDYRALDDEYQAGRAEDLVQLDAHVRARLEGHDDRPGLQAPGVLLAEDLGPAQLASLETGVVNAVATAAGGPTSHVAIMARALGIPAVVGLGSALDSVTEGQRVLVDGDSGELLIDPASDDVARYAATIERRRAEAAQAIAAAAAPAETRDGDTIEVMANAATLADARAGLDAGADGIGLLRTELLFAGDDAPTEDEQYEVLRSIALQLEDRPLTVRTFDAGADKPLPYLARVPEDNPALGVRGLRLALAEKEVFLSQLRAVSRLATEHPVRIMFPMVSTLAELHGALDLLRRNRRSTDRLEVGTMVEVPAAALMAEKFATELDFFSIGTNDLAQYIMAADRTNREVAGLADALHPAVLRAVALVAEAGATKKIRVAVCGELAGDVAAVPLLLGLGVRELSMGPRSIPVVKAAVRTVRAADARALARAALSLDSAEAVRSLLAERQ